MLFGIRTYLISFNDLVTNPSWARRMHRVLMTLPEEIAQYKGMGRTREPMIAWLESTGLTG